MDSNRDLTQERTSPGAGTGSTGQTAGMNPAPTRYDGPGQTVGLNSPQLNTPSQPLGSTSQTQTRPGESAATAATRAREEAAAIKEKTNEVIDRTKQAVSAAYDKTAETVSDTYNRTMQYGRENPGTLTLIAFGAGVGIGVLIASGMKGRGRARRIAEPIVGALSQVALEFLR